MRWQQTQYAGWSKGMLLVYEHRCGKAHRRAAVSPQGADEGLWRGKKGAHRGLQSETVERSVAGRCGLV